MSAMCNSNYYEQALVGPGLDNIFPPPYASDYTDQLDTIDADAF